MPLLENRHRSSSKKVPRDHNLFIYTMTILMGYAGVCGFVEEQATDSLKYIVQLTFTSNEFNIAQSMDHSSVA